MKPNTDDDTMATIDNTKATVADTVDTIPDTKDTEFDTMDTGSDTKDTSPDTKDTKGVAMESGEDAITEKTSLSNISPSDISQDEPMTAKRIYKNVIVVSIVFMTTFLAFGGLAVLQSSLHRVAGMGTITQSLLYACGIVSSLFLPKLTTQTLGHKRTISIALVGYIVWMVANGYAVWWTLAPTSVLVGICLGPLWTAGSSYIAILGRQYARIQRQKPEVVLANFFSIFNMCIMLSGVFAHVISATVLRKAPPENYTTPSEEDLALCGINDCPGNNVSGNANLEKPAENLVWALVGSYIGIAVLGLIISVIFVDAVPPSYLPAKKNSLINDLTATLRQLIRPKQLLLIPISMYVGLSLSFKAADYNKSFITCNLGIWMLGYVSIVFSTSDAIMSILSGKIVRKTGWSLVFLLAMCLELAVIFTYIFWTPNPDNLTPFFVLASMSGMADGIWQSQTRAVHGFIFHDHSEAAFASYNVWKSLGFFMGFGYSSQLCTIYKLYILIIDMVLGVGCYCIIEWRQRVEKARAAVKVVKPEEERLNDLTKVPT